MKGMKSMKLVIPLHSLYWSIHTKDESKRGTAFAFIFGVNWLWRCGVTASFGVFSHEIKCNGMTSFTEFIHTSLSQTLITIGYLNVLLSIHSTLAHFSPSVWSRENLVGRCGFVCKQSAAIFKPDFCLIPLSVPHVIFSVQSGMLWPNY